MTFDPSRLRRGEKIAAGSAVLLFILMFFDWYSVSVSAGPFGNFSVGGSAWQVFSFIDIYLFVVVLAAIGLAVVTATERSPALPVTASVIVTALAALGTVLVLYRLIDTPVGDVPDGVDVGRTIWAFLGLVAVGAVTYGGYLSMRDEGTTLSDAGAQARAAGKQARSAFDGATSGGDQGGSTPPPSSPPPGASAPVDPPPPPPPPAEPPPPPPARAPGAAGPGRAASAARGAAASAGAAGPARERPAGRARRAVVERAAVVRLVAVPPSAPGAPPRAPGV